MKFDTQSETSKSLKTNGLDSINFINVKTIFKNETKGKYGVKASSKVENKK